MLCMLCNLVKTKLDFTVEGTPLQMPALDLTKASAKLELLRPTVMEEMHLQESILFHF